MITSLPSSPNGGSASVYIDRNWPPAFKDNGAWPLASLRQSFLNGALTRLLDPDGVLKTKLVEFIGRGDFGLASGAKPDGGYERLWFAQTVPHEEVAFESGVFLLKKSNAEELKKKPLAATNEPETGTGGTTPPIDTTSTGPTTGGGTTPPGVTGGSPPVVSPPAGPTTKTLRLFGSVSPDMWSRFGTRVVPKLKSGKDLKLEIDFSVVVDAAGEAELVADLQQILKDLGLLDTFKIG